MSTYLVTGGAGFIGSHLVEGLLARGEAVRVIDNFATGSRDNLADVMDQIELIEVDLAGKQPLTDYFRGVDFVLHEAAIPSVPRSVADPLLAHQTCATAALNVLIAAREAGVKRVVYAASSAAYGDIEGEYKVEDMPPRPLSPYAVAKLMAEYYCQVFWNIYKLETVALRYFNVFGPRQDPNSPYSAVIPKFMSLMLEGRRPTIYGDGTQSRDFTYIENVVHGNILACTAPAEKVAGQIINMATGDSISLLQLIDSLNRVMGMNVEPIFADAAPGDVKHSRADITKARTLLNFEPVIGFDEGLARTLAWFQPQK